MVFGIPFWATLDSDFVSRLVAQPYDVIIVMANSRTVTQHQPISTLFFSDITISHVSRQA